MKEPLDLEAMQKECVTCWLKENPIISLIKRVQELEGEEAAAVAWEGVARDDLTNMHKLAERVRELERLSVLQERLVTVKDRYASSRLDIDRAIKLATNYLGSRQPNDYLTDSVLKLIQTVKEVTTDVDRDRKN